MIIVDVYVPVVNKKYDFSLNEKSKISYVVEEISEIIAQKEGCATIKAPESFLLCTYNGQEVLNPDKTLENYAIESGTMLMLI